MNTNKKIKKLNIKVKVKPRPETPVKVTGFERAEYDNSYWFTDSEGYVMNRSERNSVTTDMLYDTANYHTDKSLAEWCNRSDTLNRKMRRWAAEHNTKPMDWNKCNAKYYICYDYEESKVVIYDSLYCAYPGEVFFFDYVIAKAAIKEFGDEIKWLAENRPEWF